MEKRLIIPLHAKRTAKNALVIRKKLNKGKSRSIQGRIKGIDQARFLITNKSMSRHKAIGFFRFYKRVKNCRTKKCEMALNLWGGRKFLKNKVFRFIIRNEKKKR